MTRKKEQNRTDRRFYGWKERWDCDEAESTALQPCIQAVRLFSWDREARLVILKILEPKREALLLHPHMWGIREIVMGVCKP